MTENLGILTLGCANESPIYSIDFLPVFGSVTFASSPQYVCVCCCQAALFELYVAPPIMVRDFHQRPQSAGPN